MFTDDPIQLDLDGASVVVSQDPIWSGMRLTVDGEPRDLPEHTKPRGCLVQWACGPINGHDVVLEHERPTFWQSFPRALAMGVFGAPKHTWRVYVDGELAAERD